MNKNGITNINTFTNEFVSTIMEGNDQMSSGYEWEISYECFFDMGNQLNTETSLTLCNGDGEMVGSINYRMTRDKKCRYMYEVSCDFGEGYVSIELDDEESDQIVAWINADDKGLFDKICAYLHKYMQEQMDCGEDETCEWPPIYKERYTPSKMKAFMDKYDVSPYVPLDIELVDENGLPIKYLTIKELGFNDEGNRLIVMVKEGN